MRVAALTVDADESDANCSDDAYADVVENADTGAATSYTMSM